MLLELACGTLMHPLGHDEFCPVPEANAQKNIYIDDSSFASVGIS